MRLRDPHWLLLLPKGTVTPFPVSAARPCNCNQTGALRALRAACPPRGAALPGPWGTASGAPRLRTQACAAPLAALHHPYPSPNNPTHAPNHLWGRKRYDEHGAEGLDVNFVDGAEFFTALFGSDRFEHLVRDGWWHLAAAPTPACRHWLSSLMLRPGRWREQTRRITLHCRSI